MFSNFYECPIGILVLQRATPPLPDRETEGGGKKDFNHPCPSPKAFGTGLEKSRGGVVCIFLLSRVGDAEECDATMVIVVEGLRAKGKPLYPECRWIPAEHSRHG